MKLASVFSDSAVLQRGITIPVWGTTAPFIPVHAALNGQESWTRAADDGSFMLRLPPMEAGGPFELTVEDDNGERIVLHDILIGEVWLAGGQSNMQYELSQDWADPGIPAEKRKTLLSRQQEQEFYRTLKNPERYRVLTVPRCAPGMKLAGFSAQWQQMTPENAAHCSAVAAWFAKKIGEELDVPVGILADNWGGTIVEAWTSRSGLLRNPRTAPLVDIIDKNHTAREFWPRIEDPAQPSTLDIAKLTVKDPGNENFSKGWADTDFEDSEWASMRIPGDWMQQKISGNGSVWVRKTVDLPESWSGRDLVLTTGGIDKHDISYFNGVEIGRTGKDFEEEHWCAPRVYEIPGKLVHAGKNVIAIRAYSFIFNGGFNGTAKLYRLHLKGTEESLDISGSWKARAELNLGHIHPPFLQENMIPGNSNTFGILYKSMLWPVAPYAMRGVIWYQGESNASSMENGLDYCHSLGIMVEDWRNLWGQGDFPFIQVQLAAYNEPSEYDDLHFLPPLRESQLKLSRIMKNVGMVSALDTGMADDIHPWDKKTVGLRLADNALCKVYHRADVVPNGPVFVSAQREGCAMRLFFEDAAGLFFKDGTGRGFYVSGPERIFKRADSVKIEGNSVLVSCKEIGIPSAVRYSWADNPDGNLYNAAGHPASSFRTDSWPLA